MIELVHNRWKEKERYLQRYKCSYEVRELLLNTFKSRISPLNSTHREGIKILTPKQMLEELPIALALVKAPNISEIEANYICLVSRKTNYRKSM